MADYEELVELGFEGVDKFADKYHDQVYDHLPAWKRKKNKQEKQDQQNPQEQRSREIPQEQQDQSSRSPRNPRNQQNQQQRSSRHPDKGYSRPRSAPYGDKNDYEDDPEMYAPERRQERDYRGANDDRYRADDRSYAPGPGAVVPRGYGDFNHPGGYGAAPYPAPAQRGFDQGRDHGDRGRPKSRRRGSSWSPPREKHDRDSRKPRARSRSHDKQHRILATVGGALAGGFAGNQARKGKKFDTVATIVGAIVGGVGAREASEFWDDRRRKKEEKEEDWEEEYSDGRGSDRRKDDRHNRDNRRRH